MSTPMIITIIALGVFAAASFLYGVFRKFTQMSWIAWQIPAVFAITLLSPWIPAELDGLWRFCIALGVLFGGTALVLGFGGLVRFAMHKKKKPAPGFFRFFDRLLGGITALLDYVVILLVLAAAGLSVCYFVITPPAMLDIIFTHPIWTEFFAQHAFDIVVVTIFVFAIRGGWRVGILRALLIFFLFGLTFGAVVLPIWLIFKVPFFGDLAVRLGGLFTFLAPTAGILLGGAIVALVLFIFLFILICVLTYFLTKLVRAIRYNYFFGTLDGTLGALVAFAICLALVLLVYLGVGLLAGGVSASVGNMLSGVENAQVQQIADAIVPVLEMAGDWGTKLENLLVSAPLSEMLFRNPVLEAILGVTGA